MEKKTIGGFIATLRKANGMTQKELAEKLNVSDKTVSRWERDDGVPDLSLIPVLAEIFQVSCDELLRGERKPVTERMVAEEEVCTTKGEKQRQRLLTVSLSRYKTRSFIALGVALAGLIGAMIGNFGFLRAYIGFFVGIVFYLAGVICQAIFVNGAFLAVADDTLLDEEVGKYKQAVVRWAEGIFGLVAVLVAASLPLVVLPYDTYMGLSGESWLGYGAIWGAGTLILYSVICSLLNARLAKGGMFCWSEKEVQRQKSNGALKKKCAFTMVVVLFLTYVVHYLAAAGWNPMAFAGGTEFTDYESFVAYMEQDIPYQFTYRDGTSTTVAVEQVVPGSTTYYDQYGNEISEEEALRTTIQLQNGPDAGKVVCEYMERNNMVSSIRYTEKDGSVLPITVLTYDDLRAGQDKLSMINAVFAVAYCVEAVGMLLFYFKRKER